MGRRDQPQPPCPPNIFKKDISLSTTLLLVKYCPSDQMHSLKLGFQWTFKKSPSQSNFTYFKLSWKTKKTVDCSLYWWLCHVMYKAGPELNWTQHWCLKIYFRVHRRRSNSDHFPISQCYIQCHSNVRHPSYMHSVRLNCRCLVHLPPNWCR